MPKFKSVCIYHNHMWISISMCMRFYTHGAMNHQSYCSSQKVRVTWGPSLKRLHNGWMFITKFTCRLQELERSINSLFRHLFACKILWRPVICKLRRQKRYQSCSFFFFFLSHSKTPRQNFRPAMDAWALGGGAELEICQLERYLADHPRGNRATSRHQCWMVQPSKVCDITKKRDSTAGMIDITRYQKFNWSPLQCLEVAAFLLFTWFVPTTAFGQLHHLLVYHFWIYTWWDSTAFRFGREELNLCFCWYLPSSIKKKSW